MFYTYVLYSEQFQKIYVGYTSDIEGRLSAHNHPSNKGWTKSYQPWRILFYEEYENQREAIIREKELKTGKGRDFIRKHLPMK